MGQMLCLTCLARWCLFNSSRLGDLLQRGSLCFFSAGFVFRFPRFIIPAVFAIFLSFVAFYPYGLL